MDIKNCKKCGRVYAYDGYIICPRCRKEEEEEFKRVKEYIYDNPGVTISIAAEETGVDEKKILRYLREGKLEIKNGESNLVLDCERCGVAISTGRFCDKCAKELERELKGAIASKKDEHKSPRLTRDSDRMYIADRHKK